MKRSPFIGQIRLLIDWLRCSKESGLEIRKFMAHTMSRQEKHLYESFGNNPDIFKFSVGPTDQYGLTPMLMTFFRGCHVWCAFQPEGVKLPFRTLDEATRENPILIEINLKKNAD
jgi:hypothetical protein